MFNQLTKEEELVIKNKATEPPFTGGYDDFFEDGVYICKQCNQQLFTSKDKFKSGCGWPSFDDELVNTVQKKPDADGQRTEIICANCKGHLGHVFTGEKLTDKNTRYCVNSIAIKFIPQTNKSETNIIYLGGGCFWCTEAIFKRVPKVKAVLSGYAGNGKDNPTSEEVYGGNTGYVEVVKVEYDNNNETLDKLLEIFFKTHDPTSMDKQGNDSGEQYKSIIVYTSLDQKARAEEVIKLIESEKLYEKKIVTEIRPFVKFFPAEKYHQDFYDTHQNYPYCTVVIDPKINKLEKLLH